MSLNTTYFDSRNGHNLFSLVTWWTRYRPSSIISLWFLFLNFTKFPCTRTSLRPWWSGWWKCRYTGSSLSLFSADSFLCALSPELGNCWTYVLDSTSSTRQKINYMIRVTIKVKVNYKIFISNINFKVCALTKEITYPKSPVPTPYTTPNTPWCLINKLEMH